jgi:hypothetical protein
MCRQSLGGRLKVTVSGGALLPPYLESFFAMTGLQVRERLCNKWCVRDGFCAQCQGFSFVLPFYVPCSVCVSSPFLGSLSCGEGNFA